jgi:hypothetical protein
MAETMLALGDAAGALPLQEHVVEVYQRRAVNDPKTAEAGSAEAGTADPETAAARVQLAQIYHALGRPGEARVLAEAAIPILTAAPEHRGRLGLGRYVLARCLADLRQDRSHQRLLAALAAEDLATDDTVLGRRALADLRAWLALQPPAQ